jgi:L-fuculose-phosphate aldolase
MLENSMVRSFQEIGRDIFLRGLISSHAGNMSVRMGDRIFLTRRGSMLGRLSEKDLVELDISKNDTHILMASSETVVHRAIYRNTSALAVVHTHPPYATLLSMVDDEIIPVDSEGSYLFKKVPVVSLEKTIGSEEASRVVSEYLKEYRIVLMRGHGSFARGDMLEEAYMLTSSLESSAFYVYHMGSHGKDQGGQKEYRKFSDKYKSW